MRAVKPTHHDAEVVHDECPLCKRPLQLIYVVAGKPKEGLKFPKHLASDPGAGYCKGSGSMSRKGV